MGGGGSAGEVSFPDHMEAIHQEWFNYNGSAPTMTTSLHDVMETSLATNPLENLEYEDPAAAGGAIEEIDAELGEFETAVTGLDAQADWTSIIDSAVSKVDSAGVLKDIDMVSLISDAQDSAQNDLQKAIEKALEMVDSQVVVKAVQAFARAREKEREQMKTRYKAGMANINAERSSAYGLGLALLEMDFERELGQYESEFSNQLYTQGIQFMSQVLSTEIQSRLRARVIEKQTRDQMLSNHTQLILQYKQFISEMKKALAQVTAEIKRIGFVMDAEYVSKTTNLNWKHATWDMKVYQHGIAVLGGMGGGQALPEKPGPVSSALGGALSGAGTGAAVGSQVGAIGGPLGAGLGAAIGGLAGLFS